MRDFFDLSAVLTAPDSLRPIVHPPFEASARRAWPTLDGLLRALRVLLILCFAAGIGFYVMRSLRWPLMCDSPIMHYVNFLMQHGKQPYRGITDNNMPGAYLSEALAMRIFGAGDLGWRLYEYFLLFVLTGSMVLITRCDDWLAGFLAGSLFILQHAAEGPVAANEREQVTTVLFLLGYVCLFHAVDRCRLWPWALFGSFAGYATSIKPLSLLLVTSAFLLATAVWHRRQRPLLPPVLWTAVGFLLAISCSAGFLLQHHAVGAFWFVLHHITPAYVALAHPSFADMLRNLLPREIRWFVLIFGLSLAFFSRKWDWKRWALTLGMGAGAATFFLQQKGFNHHRYTFEVLLFLLLGMDLMHGVKVPGWPRRVAVAGLLFALLYLAPQYMRGLSTVAGNSELTLALQNDLARLGGPQLQNRVMCFDMVYGCLDALYHLQLVENTGYTGDLLLFFPEQGAASVYYRDRYLREQAQDPADLLVITNEWLQRRNTFGKLDTWPAFTERLARDYSLVSTREFPMEARTTPPAPEELATNPPRAYRLYVRKASPLATTASEALHAQP